MTRMDYVADIILELPCQNFTSEEERFKAACAIADKFVMPLVGKVDNMKDLYEFSSEFAATLGREGELEVNAHWKFYHDLVAALEKVDNGMPGWPED